MDFDLRQWLLILGPIFVIGVLLHGYLRMRASQNEIKMKLDKSFLSKSGEDASEDSLNLLKAELPNGGARVIRVDQQASIVKDSASVSHQRTAAPEAEVVDSPAEAEEDVPMLMESIELPRISATDPEPSSPAAREIIAEEAPVVKVAAAEKQAAPASGRSPGLSPGKAPPARKPQNAPEPEAVKPRTSKPESKPENKPEKFVVVNVLALSDPFPGQRLMEILLDAGMTFGEMNIFHRLQADNEPAFSLANAVEPGTFDPARMESFSSPGVTLFMRVHELSDPVTVLDELLAVADRIALDLDGEIRDETRSVMTPQTIEYCRQSVREFQYRHSA